MRQVDMILRHLEAGSSLTQLEALRLYGCGRLGARVWDLRHAGYPIRKRWKTIFKGTGSKATIAEYYLDDRNDKANP